MEFDQFYDPDVLLPGDKYNVVDKYEYAVADNSTNGNVHTRWETITSAPSGQKVQWNLQLLYQLLKIPTCYLQCFKETFFYFHLDIFHGDSDWYNGF